MDLSFKGLSGAGSHSVFYTHFYQYSRVEKWVLPNVLILPLPSPTVEINLIIAIVSLKCQFKKKSKWHLFAQSSDSLFIVL